jgi:hypothetical protein
MFIFASFLFGTNRTDNIGRVNNITSVIRRIRRRVVFCMLQHSDKYHGSVSPYILGDLCSHAERIFPVKLEPCPKEDGCKKSLYPSAQKYRRYDVI